MYKIKSVSQDTYYVGGSDRRIALFENIYPLNDGVSYNSYVIMDKKTCLLDTVDPSISEIFFEKLEDTLKSRDLDYLVIHHMEPDHSSEITRVLEKYKNVTVVTSTKAYEMYQNFTHKNIDKLILVKEGDTLSLGKHVLTFVNAPMVHWPEVIVSYDSYSKTLFSADAFGTFNALNGNLFSDEYDFYYKDLDEARRYYTNIVGKYGLQVQMLLKKASTLDIKTICPLHGPIHRKDLSKIISLYDKWSRYEEELDSTLIVYGSIYGNSEKVANLIADSLSELGEHNIKIYDASKTDKSILVSETFKYKKLVVVSSTYNMGIFTPIEEYLLDLKYHNVQNKTVAIVGNGSWAPASFELMKNIFKEMKNINLLEDVSFLIKSSIKDSELDKVEALTKALLNK